MKLLRTNSNTSNGSSALADSAESMLNSMQKFVSAVNSMDETILVPNRLKDMAADVHQVPDASGMVSGARSGEVSPCPSETPPMQEENNHIDDNESVDLYSFYAMLNAVKMELERGGKPHGVEEEVNPVYKHGPGVKSKVKLNEAVTDQRSMAVARRFRSHISGLNRCLIQMTETAEFLSNKYQEDVTNPWKNTDREIGTKLQVYLIGLLFNSFDGVTVYFYKFTSTKTFLAASSTPITQH